MHTILIVDRRADDIAMLADWFEEYDFCLLVASSGLDAIDVLAREHVDLLLTEIAMPGMLGYELVNRVRPLYPTMKCAFITDGGPDTSETIAKPWSARDVVSFAEKILGLADA